MKWSDTIPFMFANLDYLGEDGRNVQIKTSRYGEAWGAQGTDEVPAYVYAQVQHEMAAERTGLTDVPSPFFATLIMGTVSSLVLAALLAGTGRLTGVAQTGRGGAWFAASGVINGLGILALNTALEIGGVTTTSPLVATAPS